MIPASVYKKSNSELNAHAVAYGRDCLQVEDFESLLQDSGEVGSGIANACAANAHARSAEQANGFMSYRLLSTHMNLLIRHI